ncbi:MAG: hypothetical protein OEV76_00880, partial [Anaerolineae bacterium]|nr:hypothetical protein [Anaerolineae bacterium]
MSRALKYILTIGTVLLAVVLGYLAATRPEGVTGEAFVVAADLDPQYLPPASPAGPPMEVPTSEPLVDGAATTDQASLPSEEGRALWVPRWSYKTAADVRTIVRNAAGANFNILLFQVRGNGDAYYSSVYEPWADRLTGTLGRYPGW